MVSTFRRIWLAALLVVTPLVDPGCSSQPDRQYFNDLQVDGGLADGSSGTEAGAGTGGAGGTPVAGSGGRDAGPADVVTDADDVAVGGGDAMGGSGGVVGAGGTDAGPGVCGDGLQNGDETDRDCGGSCPPCDVGRRCVVATDCAIGECIVGLCRTASCVDLALSGTETDVDCGGGECPRCAPSQACEVGDDCSSLI
jgi:hypothetical protein